VVLEQINRRGREMKGKTHGGKGSSQRPTNYLQYADNYDAIFSKKKSKEQKPKDKKEVKK